jgi:hypothetical protein
MLGVLSVVAMCLYVYFVASSVLHVVVRQESEQRAADVRADIAAMEAELMAAQHHISQRLATAVDFTSDTNKIFVQRAASDVALRPNDAE